MKIMHAPGAPGANVDKRVEGNAGAGTAGKKKRGKGVRAWGTYLGAWKRPKETQAARKKGESINADRNLTKEKGGAKARTKRGEPVAEDGQKKRKTNRPGGGIAAEETTTEKRQPPISIKMGV